MQALLSEEILWLWLLEYMLQVLFNLLKLKARHSGSLEHNEAHDKRERTSAELIMVSDVGQWVAFLNTIPWAQTPHNRCWKQNQNNVTIIRLLVWVLYSKSLPISVIAIFKRFTKQTFVPYLNLFSHVVTANKPELIWNSKVFWLICVRYCFNLAYE